MIKVDNGRIGDLKKEKKRECRKKVVFKEWIERFMSKRLMSNQKQWLISTKYWFSKPTLHLMSTKSELGYEWDMIC